MRLLRDHDAFAVEGAFDANLARIDHVGYNHGHETFVAGELADGFDEFTEGFVGRPQRFDIVRFHTDGFKQWSCQRPGVLRVGELR